MNFNIRTLILLFLSVFTFSAQGQIEKLKPGFDKKQYIEMLKITARQVDTPWTKVTVPFPEKFQFVYRSKVIGLDNQWDLWLSKDSIAVISLRGTTADQTSWLANFYAGMVPAAGKLELEKNFTFEYHLADNPKAAVHIGWLVGMAYLQRDILPKIDSCYNKLGIRNFIIMGHSQGGAIAYMLTSHLENLKQQHKLPTDIRFKTYCSAAPKPGNLYYAYDYENLTRNGWAYNVVNAADWVPETPFSIQTVNDFNTVNPFTNAKRIIKKQKFPVSMVLNHIYKQMDKPTKKSQRTFEKYLGKKAYTLLKKKLPEFKQPVYIKSSNYVRTGVTIVLLPDADYYKKYPDDNKVIFSHHFPEPYLYLAEKLKE